MCRVGLPEAFRYIATSPVPVPESMTARSPVTPSAEHARGVWPVSCKVAIGLVPPCAYSRICDAPPSGIKTFPALSAHKCCGESNPVRVPTKVRFPQEKTSTSGFPWNGKVETYSRFSALAVGSIHECDGLVWAPTLVIALGDCVATPLPHPTNPTTASNAARETFTPNTSTTRVGDRPTFSSVLCCTAHFLDVVR